MASVWIALLRAVNLGSHQPVAMSALREMVAGLGFTAVRTLLQSGNLVFACNGGTDAEIGATLEREAAVRLNLSTDFMVRSAEDWTDVVAANPFPEEAERDPGHLVAFVLKSPVTAQTVEGLQSAIAGREVVRGEGRTVYASYPDGIGKSKLTNAAIERKLGTRVTGRNWNTVLKLLELSRSGG